MLGLRLMAKKGLDAYELAANELSPVTKCIPNVKY